MGEFLLLGIPILQRSEVAAWRFLGTAGVGQARRVGLARGVGVTSTPCNAALLPRDRGQICYV